MARKGSQEKRESRGGAEGKNIRLEPEVESWLMGLERGIAWTINGVQYLFRLRGGRASDQKITIDYWSSKNDFHATFFVKIGQFFVLYSDCDETLLVAEIRSFYEAFQRGEGARTEAACNDTGKAGGDGKVLEAVRRLIRRLLR